MAHPSSLMLKKSASTTDRGVWSARQARKTRSEVRSSGFEVSKTSNFGPRALPRLAHPASLARLSCGVGSHSPKRADHRSLGVPKWFSRGLLNRNSIHGFVAGPWMAEKPGSDQRVIASLLLLTAAKHSPSSLLSQADRSWCWVP